MFQQIKNTIYRLYIGSNDWLNLSFLSKAVRIRCLNKFDWFIVNTDFFYQDLVSATHIIGNPMNQRFIEIVFRDIFKMPFPGRMSKTIIIFSF